MMTLADVLFTGGVGLVAGGAIGCIGVGGVIIVPVLVQFAGVPIHIAISVAMAGYVLTGIVGAWVYLRKGSVDWRDARLLCVGAIPAAIAGALAASAAPGVVLEFIIAALAISSGVQTLLKRPPDPNAAQVRTLSAPTNLGLGLVTGFLSSLTGTGGPAVLIPFLLWLDVPVLLTIGLAQVVQLPIALLATVGNVWSGTYDVAASVTMGLSLAVGTWFGAHLAHRLSQQKLRLFVALVLFAVGVMLLIKGGRDLV